MTARYIMPLGLAVLAVTAAATGLHAQPANPITASTRNFHDNVRGFVTRAAEQFPEDQYSFPRAPADEGPGAPDKLIN